MSETSSHSRCRWLLYRALLHLSVATALFALIVGVPLLLTLAVIVVDNDAGGPMFLPAFCIMLVCGAATLTSSAVLATIVFGYFQRHWALPRWLAPLVLFALVDLPFILIVERQEWAIGSFVATFVTLMFLAYRWAVSAEWLWPQLLRGLCGVNEPATEAIAPKTAEQPQITRCDVCKLTTTLPSTFRRERSAFRPTVRFLCPYCWRRQQDKTYQVITVIWIVIAVLGSGIYIFDSESKPLWLAPAFLFAYMALNSVWHELAHALGALLVGMRLFCVVIGSIGPIWRMSRLFGYDICIHRVPHGGCVLTTIKSTRWARCRNFVMILCGPLSHCVNIAIALAIARRWPNNELLYHGTRLAILADSMCLMASFYPSKIWTGSIWTIADGWQLLKIPRLSDAQIVGGHASWFYLEGLESRERGRLDEAIDWFQRGIDQYPQEFCNHSGLGLALIDRQQYDAAKECFAAAQQCPALAADVEAVLWNNIAWADLLIGNSESIAEADRLSQQAVERIPGMAEARSTRGCVLVELGQLDEGIALIGPVQVFGDAATRALKCGYIALAHARGGRPEQADDYLRRARGLDSECPLLGKVEQEIAALCAASL